MSGPGSYLALTRAKREVLYVQLRLEGLGASFAAARLHCTGPEARSLEGYFHGIKSGEKPHLRDAKPDRHDDHLDLIWEANPKGFVGAWSFDPGGAGFKSGPVVIPGPAYSRSAL